MLPRVAGELNNEQISAFCAAADTVDMRDVGALGCRPLQQAVHLGVGRVDELDNGAGFHRMDTGQGQLLSGWRRRQEEDQSEEKRPDRFVPFIPFTSQSSQGVEAALLLTGEEAVTIQEVGPGHFDGLEGVGAVLPQSVAGAAAGFDHLVVEAGRGDDGAADQAYLGGALPVEQAVDDAQQQVLGSRLCIHAGAVPQDVGEDGPGEVARGFIIESKISRSKTIKFALSGVNPTWSNPGHCSSPG